MVIRVRVRVQGSKVLVNRGLITRGDARIRMQWGVDCKHVVSDRGLRGFSRTSSLGRGSLVVSGRGVRHSSSVVSGRGWGWSVSFDVWDLNSIKDFSRTT